MGKSNTPELTNQKIREIAIKRGWKPPSNKGKHFSEEHRRKISLSNKGKHKYYKHSGKRIKGKNHHWWRGGRTKKNLLIRASVEYKWWKRSVFERDNYTCIWCGQRSGDLEADHIKPFALYPELRFAIDNGRTLCESCHKTTDTYGRLKVFRIK